MRVAINFQGRVQGVGFRMTARHVATNYAITGWVRNESDGSVQLEAQGTAEVIEDYLNALRELMGRNIRLETRCDLADIDTESGFTIQK